MRRKRAFWEPGKFAVQYGLPKIVRLGEDGPDAKARALQWNRDLDRARATKGEEKPSRYGAGTLGAFYDWFRRKTDAWQQMGERNREDYARAWTVIEKRFGRTLWTDIDALDSEAFHVDIHPAHAPHKKRDPKGKLKLPWNTAHRVLKVWRALLNALVSYNQIPSPAPIGRVSNPEPPPREDLWLHDEVMALYETAAWGGELGLAVAIRIAWDAMLSPQDAWALPIGGWRYSAKVGGEIDTQRAKTDKSVFVAVSDDTAELIELWLAYLKRAGADMSDDAPIVRQRSLKPFRDKDAFGKAFRRVRAAAFPGDRRQFLDLRRSALTEARMGGATKDDIGAAAANQVDKSKKLEATYLRAASRNVLAARTKGRKPMADKFG